MPTTHADLFAKPIAADLRGERAQQRTPTAGAPDGRRVRHWPSKTLGPQGSAHTVANRSSRLVARGDPLEEQVPPNGSLSCWSSHLFLASMACRGTGCCPCRASTRRSRCSVRRASLRATPTRCSRHGTWATTTLWAALAG